MQLEEGSAVHLLQGRLVSAWPHTTVTLLMGFYILLPARW